MTTNNVPNPMTPFPGAAGASSLNTGLDSTHTGLELAPSAQLRKRAEAALTTRADGDGVSRAISPPFGLLEAPREASSPIRDARIDLRTPTTSSRVDPFMAELDPTTMAGDLQKNWEAIMDAFDPGGLIDKFRNGDLRPEHLKGEAGQLVMMKLKDRLAQVQAFMDAVRGILDAYNDAMKRTAQNIRA